MDTWLVVGLGNPGPDYAGNRHNVGAMAVEGLAARDASGAASGRASFKAHKARARVAEVRLRIPGPKVVLAVPSTYMNVSGGPVSALLKYYDVPVERLIVLHDELDIPFDNIKLKTGGGHGGHNGVRDVAKALDSADFARVRVGIGRPVGRQDPADWVLDPFGTAERKNLPVLLGDAADAVERLVDDGLLAAQQKHHAPRA